MAEEEKTTGKSETGPEEVFEEEIIETQEREDERWSSASQLNDWMLLIAFAILQATWMIIVILFEPGIR